MKIYNLNEITDSKIQYDKRPPAFMNIIILVVVIFIILALLWANNNQKTFVVKGQGIVTSDEKSYIMTKTSGEIDKVFIEEGKVVEEGDELFTINNIEIDIQLQQVISQSAIYNKRIDLINRAEKNLKNGTNNFNKSDSIESEFYNRLSEIYISRKEFEVDIQVLKDKGYTQVEIDEYILYQKDKYNEHYYKSILEFTNEKNQYEIELSKLEGQRVALEKSREEYKVIAKKSGIVHINTVLTKGMVIQSGNLVGSISSKEEDLILEVMIPSSDRPRIHNNDDVSIIIGGLLQSEYGSIQGKVISIDEDATIDSEKGSIYFKVKVKPEKTYLEDSSGERVNLSIGMVGETRVKYEKVTYMKYLLEQIGVKFN